MWRDIHCRSISEMVHISELDSQWISQTCTPNSAAMLTQWDRWLERVAVSEYRQAEAGTHVSSTFVRSIQGDLPC